MSAPSRTSTRGAGWECRERGIGAGLAPRGNRFSWLRPGPLIASRNDVLARRLGDDPTNEQRRTWLRRLDEYARAAGAAPPPPDRLVTRFADRDRISVAVLGDPGEGDASQYVVVPVLEEVACASRPPPTRSSSPAGRPPAAGSRSSTPPARTASVPPAGPAAGGSGPARPRAVRCPSAAAAGPPHTDRTPAGPR